MKREASKKSKLWLWLVIGAVVLLVAGGITAFLLMSGSDTEATEPAETTTPGEATGGRPELYWNVDRAIYTVDSQTSTREPGEDGAYKIRFAYNGTLVEKSVADKKLVNYIDTLDALGLVFDDNGLVVDAMPPKEVAKEIAKNAFVKRVGGETIEANTSVAMNGMPVKIKMIEGAEIYDVTPEAEVPGQVMNIGALKPMDTLTVYGDEEGNVTHVFVTSHARESKVYWRADQFYSSAEKSTTREPDENGVYTVPFFCEGETVELKFKDKALVTKIDSISRWKCHFGFTFDEEGYVVEQFTSSLGIAGLIKTDCWDVVDVQDDTYTVQRLTTNDGSVWTGTIPAGTPIYEAGIKAKQEGEGGRQIESLQIGDRVTIWTDTTENVVLVYVAERIVDSPAYWIPTRKYNTAEKSTTREIGASGYYEIELIKEGSNKKEVYYVRDKATMSYIDSQTSKIVGLEVESGNIIKYAYNAEALTGYTTATRGGIVSNVAGSIITKISYGKRGSEASLILAANAKVYNVSQYGTLGAETTIRPGDHIYAQRQPTGELLLVYVTKRALGGSHLYWNLDMQWDKTNKTSTRVPDAEGWYYFNMTHQGKQVTLKTQNKELVDKLDKLSIGATCLEVSGDVITNVYDATYAYGGNKVASGYLYQYKNSDGTYHAIYASDKTKTVDFKMAENCAIYNVSPVFEEFQGERIYSIPKGAMLTAFCNMYGEAEVVYVRKQSVKDMYWKTEILYDSTNKVTKRTPDADGYYWYDLAINGELKTFKTKDQKIANSMDSYAGAFGLSVKGDEIMGFVATSSVYNCGGNGYTTATITAINGRKISVTHSKGTDVITLSSDCKIYDVSPVAESFGAVTQLKVGDVIRTYVNTEKTQHIYVYVKARASRVHGETGYCEVCKKDVTWKPMDTSSAISAADGHWYVPANMTAWVQSSFASESKDYTICLDLNGKTLSRATGGRMFRVAYNETLNIMDSVGGGKIITNGGTSYNGGMMMVTSGATVNMYGGTLEFVDKGIKNGQGGMVYLSGEESVFNLYDGVITGGISSAQNKDKTGAGGNFYIVGGATLNMYAGEISDGKVYGGVFDNGSGGYKAVAPCGGNIYMSESSMVNIYGGVVKGGESVREVLTDPNGTEYGILSLGGNIYKVNTNKLDGRLYIENAIVSEGKAHRGANIYTTSGSAGRIELRNATIFNGHASQFGGNIMTIGGQWTVVDSVISDGVSDQQGGNIYSQGGVFENVTGTTISGGKAATAGGNIYLYKNKTDENIFVVGEGTVIENGVTTSGNGGNVYIKNKNYVQLGDGKVVAPADDDGTGEALLPALVLAGGEIRNGQAASGANIYSAGHLGIISGKISGGKVTFVGGGEAMLSIVGGEVADELSVKAPASFDLSGAPKLANLIFDKNVKAAVGQLTDGAEIKVSTSGTPVFTEAFDAAAEYLSAGYFKPYNEAATITVTAENELSLEAAPLSTREAYCAHCDMMVTWTEWDKASAEKIDEDGHFYLTADIQLTSHCYVGTSSSNKEADGHDVVVDLNGKKVNSTAAFFYVYPYSTLTVMDLAGGAEVTGMGVMRKSAPGEGGLFYVEGSYAKLNIYSGTFTLTNGEKVSNGGIIRNGGTTKIYGGTFNGNTINGVGTTVYSTKVLEIHGGTFNGTVNFKNALTLSGAPVVETVEVQSGAIITLGELTDGANITLVGEGVVSEPNANAQAYLEAGYIKSGTTEELNVTLQNELSFGEVVIEGLLEYACPHCNGAVAQWLPYDANNVSGVLKGNNAHYYIPDGGYIQSYGQVSIQGEITLDFRGQTLIGKGAGDGSIECKRLWRIEGTFNILDTVGGGKAIAYGLAGGAGALAMTRKNPDTNEPAVINMYGGTLTMFDDCQTGSSGGILSLASDTVMNMYGGEIYGGKATHEHAQNVYINDATLNMYGGFIDGGVELTANGTINLSGTAKIGSNNGGLWIEEGKLIGLGAMETGAEIYVATTRAAYITNTLTNASNYLTYIKAVETGWEVLVNENALMLTNGEIPEEPFDPNKVCEKANAMDFTTTDPEGKVTAVCPVCELEVEWSVLPAINDGKSNTSVASGHYYLSADVDYTQNNGLYNFTNKQICIHLNGQELTSSVRAFYNEKTDAVLNVMGDGTVTGVGSYNSGKPQGAIDLTANGNFYGGTYVSTGSGPAIGNRKTSSGNAIVNIYAGTTVINDQGTAVEVYKNSALKIFGGTFQGPVQETDSLGITVSGAPVINNLVVAAGEKITVGTLTDGAAITVYAEGVFTGDFANAQAYLDAGYFVTGVADTELKVEGNALSVTAIVVPDEPVIPETPVELEPNDVYEYAKTMDFTAGGTVTALCPACGEEHDWQPLPAPTSSKNSLLPGGAYYVAEDTEVTKFWYIQSEKVCVHLNGKTITNTSDRIFYVENDGGMLNIMGEGTVTGKAKYNSANLNFVGVIDACATVNLYGGNWKSSTEYPVIAARGSKEFSVLNIYDGTVVERTAEDVAGLNLYIADGSTVNMYGGVIRGGTAIEHAGFTAGKIGGNVLLKAIYNSKNYPYHCVFNYYGGVIENGTAQDGGANIAAIGNDYSNPTVTVNLYAHLDAETVMVTGANAFLYNDFCPHCNEQMDQIAWQELTIPTDEQLILSESGHYYLAADVDSLYKQIAVKGGDVVVDLRGHNINAGTGRAFYVGDENADTACSLSLIDSVGNAEVTGSYTSAGGVLYIITATESKVPGVTANVLNVYGGTYTNTGNPANGGCINNTRAIVNIYGGTFNGATIDADKYGGTMCVNGGTANIYGGTFTNGNANGAGDCICVLDYKTTNDGILNIYGGNIQGQVLVKAGAEINISGKAVITDLELEETVLATFGYLKEGTDITVDAIGAFSAANANAQTYVTNGWVKAVTGKEITVTDDVMSIG